MTNDVFALLLSVLRSWEVIAVTVAIVMYLFLVFYVARLYRKPKKPMFSFERKPKAEPPPKVDQGPEVIDDEE